MPGPGGSGTQGRPVRCRDPATWPGVQGESQESEWFFCIGDRAFSFLQRNAPEEKASVGPWLLALFIFVVCGSGKCFGGDHRVGCWMTGWG